MNAKEAYALSSVAGSRYDTELERVFNKIRYEAGEGSYTAHVDKLSEETINKLKELDFTVYVDTYDGYVSVHWS